MNKIIVLGADHAGFPFKLKLIHWLVAEGYTLKDVGTHSIASADYPDFAHQVAAAVTKGEAHFGILLCGSGNGVAITANKHQGIRAALCWAEEVAALARQHNDANVLAIPARFVTEEVAIRMTRTFLTTDFEGGRHNTRVQKIACT